MTKELHEIAQNIDGFPMGSGQSDKSRSTSFGIAMKKQKDRIYRVQTGEFDSQFQILSAGKKHGQQMWRLARSGPWDLGVPFLPVRKNEEDSISVGAEEGHLRYSGPPSIDDSEELGIF